MNGIAAWVAVVVVSVAAASSVDAKIYKYVLPDGRIIYSDKPQPGAEEVELPPLQTIAPTPVPPSNSNSGSVPSLTKGYDKFEVTSPANDSVMRDNGGSVSIALSLEPGLQRDHVIEIYFDGAMVGSGKSTSLTLTNVDRGSHSVFAVVKSDGRELKRTSPVSFHLKRAALGSSINGGESGAFASGAGAVRRATP